MRPRHLLPLIATSAMLMAGCANRIAKGDAAPLAPPDGSDRASSARFELSPAQRQAQPLAGALFAVDTDAVGLTANLFAG